MAFAVLASSGGCTCSGHGFWLLALGNHLLSKQAGASKHLESPCMEKMLTQCPDGGPPSLTHGLFLLQLNFQVFSAF
jgi:hypothetical protein